MNQLAVVVVVTQAITSVSDPGGTSCCRSVSGCGSHLSAVGVKVASVAVLDRHSTLFGHVSWLAVRPVANRCCTLSVCSFSSLFVVVVSFAFSFVAVSFSLTISLSFERISLSNRLIALAVFSFVAVVAVVVPVSALSFALAPALLPFAFVVP